MQVVTRPTGGPQSTAVPASTVISFPSTTLCLAQSSDSGANWLLSHPPSGFDPGKTPCGDIIILIQVGTTYPDPRCFAHRCFSLALHSGNIRLIPGGCAFPCPATLNHRLVRLYDNARDEMPTESLFSLFRVDFTHSDGPRYPSPI